MPATQNRTRRSVAQKPLPCFSPLEQRQLLSTTSPPAFLPNESTLTSPRFANLWQIQNTGQTLTNNSQGPATGLAGADISAAQAWNLTTGSSNVIVAVLDTGIDWSQPDLAANIWTNPGETNNGLDNDGNGYPGDIHGWNFVTNTNNTSDTVGHGTSVAGVIGAVGNNGLGIVGVDWNVSLLPVVVGTAAGVNDNNLVAGINYVTALRKKGFNIVAINASYLDTTGSPPTSADISAIANAGKAGILYVNAAGNGGADISALNLLPGWASLTNVITVAATNNQDQLASFSNFGSSVQLAAPGVDILTTTLGNTYSTLSGTSYAAPMVSGAVALLASENPSASMSQIKNAILSSVDVLPQLSGDVTTGGRLNVYNALETLIGSLPPTGAVEQVTASTVSGYAFDANAGQLPINVSLYIDGTLKNAISAQLPRPDLAPLLGSINHGYSFSLASYNLAVGSHTISVYAADYPSNKLTLLGTQTLTINAGYPIITLNNSPIGNNQPGAIDFSGQLVGAPAQSRTFNIQNGGNFPLTLSGLTVPAAYTIITNFASTVAAGASTSFTVQLNTTTKGVFQGNISFTWGPSNVFAFPVSGAIGDSSFVEGLYLDLLDRSADSAGLAYWNNTLINKTMTPAQITAGFINSTEYRTLQIQNLYNSILRRPVDSSGLAYWLNAYAAGSTYEQISSDLYGSSEYFTNHASNNNATLNGFYLDILKRSLDQAGLNYWNTLLDSGASRTLVAIGIINTTEGEQRTVSNIYTTYLQRPVDAAGLTYWTNILASGQTQADILISILSAPEYFAR